MIKFFRHLRQILLTGSPKGVVSDQTDKKLTNYLLYAIGEIILVVLGILIALHLNNNAENRKLDEKRQVYYSQLLEDFNNEIINFNNFRKEAESDLIAYNRYQDIYKKDTLRLHKIYEELVKLNMYSNVITFNTSTIESIRNSGELILFPLEIRNKLMNVIRIQALILNEIEANNGGKNDLLMHLGKIRGASTLFANLEGHKTLIDQLKFDEHLPEIILSLDAAHRWKELSETVTLNYLETMQKEIESIMKLINDEMNDDLSSHSTND